MTSNVSIRRGPPAVAVALALALTLAACGADEGTTVRDLGAEGTDESAGSATGSSSGSASSPASGSSSGSASAVAGESAADSASGSASAVAGAGGGEVSGDGGYQYASNVDAHRLVTVDVCRIKELLAADPVDFDAVAAVYSAGGNSVNADGSVRTLAGFAAGTPIGDFVSEALGGTGAFSGESDAVRAQGTEKGIQNQLLVAWTVDELDSALAKAAAGDFDVASGAVHNWDEAWAFYHGAEPGCGPYATADSRADNFGTMNADGTMAKANAAILTAMKDGRDALLAEDADGSQVAAEEIKRNIWITYSQATVRYATLIEGDLAEGNREAAREHQAEGLAFWRVIEADATAMGADGAAVNAIVELANEPGASGFGDEVRAALAPFWESAGITEDDIGTLE